MRRALISPPSPSHTPHTHNFSAGNCYTSNHQLHVAADRQVRRVVRSEPSVVVPLLGAASIKGLTLRFSLASAGRATMNWLPFDMDFG